MITNPAIDVLQRELDETEHSITELSEALKAAKAKQKSLGEALAVLTGQPVYAGTSRDTSSSGPTLKEQILELLSPDGMGLAPAEIANLLTENGRETGNTTVSSTLSRMVKEGVVVKRGGKWFLPQQATTQDTTHGDASSDEPTGRARHSLDWAKKVSQDITSPQQNPASAGAGQAKVRFAGGETDFLTSTKIPYRDKI